MALTLLGKNIAPSSNLSLLGQSIKLLKLNGEVVWRKYTGAPSPVYIEDSTILTASVDFPSGIPVTICMAGGGGGGESDNNSPAYGGFKGEIASGTFTFDYNENIDVTIGSGGAPSCGGGACASAGTDTVFGTYLTALGGKGGCAQVAPIGYAGNGAVHTSPCGEGDFTDGSYRVQAYGGEAGAFGNGGQGHPNNSTIAGEVSAGGGASANDNCGGYGGKGKIKISW